jgi:ethanolamine utilization protein EutN
MILGRVIGRVWSTVKNRELDGLRMLVVQPLTPELKPTGRRIICTDCTGAGTGELVYWVRGKEASFPFLPAEPPTDTTIVGIVDEVHLERPAVDSPAEARKGAAPHPRAKERSR